MIDIHTHLYWESYDEDRDEVIARAHKAGVEKMFVVGCTLGESQKCVVLSEKYPEIFASVGIHPNELTKELEKKTFSLLQETLRILAKQKKVIAIGECGLDYYKHGNGEKITEDEKHLQKEGFVIQMALAEDLGLPLIAHCRPSVGTMDAYEDLYEVFCTTKYQLKNIILHCYMGDTEMTKGFLSLPNVLFSFTGNITYPVKKMLVGTKDDLTETVKMIPIDRLFVETDCPFLAPQEMRGKRNEPAYVASVLGKVAEIQGKKVSEIESSTNDNVERIFMV